MKTFSFTMKYADVREISFLAKDLEDAQAIVDSGDWLDSDEVTIDFYADDLVEGLKEVT